MSELSRGLTLTMNDRSLQTSSALRLHEGETPLPIDTDAYHALVDSVPALLHSARADGFIDLVNRGWLDYFGLPYEAVCGWTWAERFHPDDVEDFLSKWRAALATGEPFEAEGRVLRADGEYRTLLHRKVPVRYPYGEIRWYGSSIDIEDQKRAEQSIRLVADTTPALLHTGRPDGYLDYFNRGWLDFLGAQLGEIEGWNWTSKVHPDDIDELVQKWRSSIASGTALECESRVRRIDGQY